MHIPGNQILVCLCGFPLRRECGFSLRRETVIFNLEWSLFGLHPITSCSHADVLLTLCMLGKISADNILKYFFLIFPRKQDEVSDPIF